MKTHTCAAGMGNLMGSHFQTRGIPVPMAGNPRVCPKYSNIKYIISYNIIKFIYLFM